MIDENLPAHLEAIGRQLTAAAHDLASPAHQQPSQRPSGARVRPSVFAGGTLGLAGVGAALMIALTAGGAAAPPAFAVTRHSDGSLTVNLDSVAGWPGANRKLAALGADEHIVFQMAPGTAAASGAVSCVPASGLDASGQPVTVGASVAGPPVNLTVGPGVTNVETVETGNTGTGTWHVAACWRLAGTGDTTDPGTATGPIPGGVPPLTTTTTSSSSTR